MKKHASDSPSSAFEAVENIPELRWSPLPEQRHASEKPLRLITTLGDYLPCPGPPSFLGKKSVKKWEMKKHQMTEAAKLFFTRAYAERVLTQPQGKSHAAYIELVSEHYQSLYRNTGDDEMFFEFLMVLKEKALAEQWVQDEIAKQCRGLEGKEEKAARKWLSRISTALSKIDHERAGWAFPSIAEEWEQEADLKAQEKHRALQYLRKARKKYLDRKQRLTNTNTLNERTLRDLVSEIVDEEFSTAEGFTKGGPAKEKAKYRFVEETEKEIDSLTLSTNRRATPKTVRKFRQ